MFFSQEDIENFKAEIEKRQLTEEVNGEGSEELKPPSQEVEVH